MKQPKRKGASLKKQSRPQLVRGRNDKLVQASVLCRCFGMTSTMPMTIWRQKHGLPHWRVRSDQSEEGYVCVYDLDDVAKWALEHGRPFDRELAFVAGPKQGWKSDWRGPKDRKNLKVPKRNRPKPVGQLVVRVPRIPRDERISP